MEGLINKQLEEYMCSNFPSAAVTKHSEEKQKDLYGLHVQVPDHHQGLSG